MTTAAPANDTAYRRMEVKAYPRVPLRQSAESKYWRQFKNPVLTKVFGAVNGVAFSPTLPHNFVVTSTSRIDVFNGNTRTVDRSITQVKQPAYGVDIRRDGRLIVLGCEDGSAQVFDLKTRPPLRTCRSHRRTVRTVRWTWDQREFLSGSDDGNWKLWDLATGDELLSVDAHSDYLRSMVLCSAESQLIATGGYDHRVKLWDLRSATSSLSSSSFTDPRPAFVMDHGAPVEALLAHPSGHIVVSAGQNYIKVWDLLSGGRCLHTVSNHQKTITSLCWNRDASRLLSGGLDHLLKVYDVSTYDVVHSAKFSDPILTVGLSPDEINLVVGMSSGSLSIRQRDASAVDTDSGGSGSAAGSGSGSASGMGGSLNAAGANDQFSDFDWSKWSSIPSYTRDRLRTGSYKFFLRGQNTGAGPDDLRVEQTRKQKLREFDSFLKKFQYRNALDAALNTNDPSVIVSMFEELTYRDGLQVALAGRDEAALIPVLKILVKHVVNPRYSTTLVNVTHVTLDIYSGVLGLSMEVDELVHKLRARLISEIRFQEQLFPLCGMMESLMAAAASTASRGASVHESMIAPVPSALPPTSTTTTTTSSTSDVL